MSSSLQLVYWIAILTALGVQVSYVAFRLQTKRKQAISGGPSQLDTVNHTNKVRCDGLPLLLILNGSVKDTHLEKIGQTRFWLKNQIQKKGARRFHEVGYCTIDHRGDIYLSLKEEYRKS